MVSLAPTLTEQLNLDLQDEVSELIAAYVSRISSNRATPIFDAEHLSRLVGYDANLIYSISNSPRHYYRTFKIKKKGGGERQIDEPLPTLKEIQHWLLRNVFENVPVSRSARAFKKGNTIKGNALIHARQNIILRMDIKDFFPSILFSDVKAILYNLGYTEPLSIIIANLCCLNGRLPQGAPTSPAISNIYMTDVDTEILKACRQENLRYTRYADDMVISGAFQPQVYMLLVREILERKNLKVNKGKTALFRNGSRKIVTGLVVNNGVSVPSEIRRQFRMDVHFIRRWGLDGHMRRRDIKTRNYLEHLIGVGVHINSIHRRDARAAADLAYLRELSRLYS